MPEILPELAEEIRRHQDSALKIAERRLGPEPIDIEYQSGGASNFVFIVKYPSDHFVIRLSPVSGKIDSYHKEEWAISRARGAGVPAPEVIEVARNDDASTFMIVRRVEGTEGTDHPERLSTLEEMGRHARLIHSIPTRGYGANFDWAPAHATRNKNWNEFLERELELSKRLALLERHGMLNDKQLTRIRATLTAVPEQAGGTGLNHGDLRLKNVIVDEKGRINAIIDWELAMSLPPPYWELAIALHDLSVDGKEAFLRGYGMTDEHVSEIMPILRSLNLINYAPVVAQAAEKNDTQQLDLFRTRLRGVLDLYGA